MLVNMTAKEMEHVTGGDVIIVTSSSSFHAGSSSHASSSSPSAANNDITHNSLVPTICFGLGLLGTLGLTLGLCTLLKRHIDRQPITLYHQI